MIPRIIHYCWFGRNPKPHLVKKCIRSWNKYCRQYQLMEWTEDNFDLGLAPQYVQDAYKEKKWAFVADYVRLDALVKYGGIYLDTDIELLGSLDPFLKNEAFSGTEDGVHVSAGLMGCVKNYSLFRGFRDYYKSLSFYNEDNTINITTIVVMLTQLCEEKGYVPGNFFQNIEGFVIYPSEYFYPLSIDDAILRKTANTVAIHWFAGSWETKEKRRWRKKRQLKNRIKLILVSFIGNKRFEKLKTILHYKPDN